METREYRTLLRRELTDFATALLTEHPAFGWRLLRREAGTWQSVRSLCTGIVSVPPHLTAIVDAPNEREAEASAAVADAIPAEAVAAATVAAGSGGPGGHADGVAAGSLGGDSHSAEPAADGGSGSEGGEGPAYDLWHVMWTPWPGCTNRCRHRAVVFFHEGLVWSYGAYFDAHESHIPLSLG